MLKLMNMALLKENLNYNNVSLMESYDMNRATLNNNKHYL